ncbi:MAG: pyridine nucleotide-disulfide oxidoreductase, partial [Proteobacteria bacterium]|nr:pyridine nucleotide-disulfide oxidoreductase [Pseudomonadota bacterium]
RIEMPRIEMPRIEMPRIEMPRIEESGESDDAFIQRLNAELGAVVEGITRPAVGMIELTVRAPLAARMFKAGQFFRLQNYETHALRTNGTTLAMEGVATLAAEVDPEAGTVSLIVAGRGGSSDLAGLIKPGEPIALMGPTGAPAEIPEGETVLLAGAGYGVPALLPFAKAMKAKGCRVLFFAGASKTSALYRPDAIEDVSDTLIRCGEQDPEPAEGMVFVGDVVDAIGSYGRGELGVPVIALSEVDRIVTIAPEGVMRALAEARHGVLKELLKPGHLAYGAINSPMQCMMKEICAQCLQPRTDPASGETRLVFSCADPNQPLDEVDFDALAQRLSQNAVQEKLTRLWVERCLAGLDPARS